MLGPHATANTIAQAVQRGQNLTTKEKLGIFLFLFLSKQVHSRIVSNPQKGVNDDYVRFYTGTHAHSVSTCTYWTLNTAYSVSVNGFRFI